MQNKCFTKILIRNHSVHFLKCMLTALLSAHKPHFTTPISIFCSRQISSDCAYREIIALNFKILFQRTVSNAQRNKNQCFINIAFLPQFCIIPHSSYSTKNWLSSFGGNWVHVLHSQDWPSFCNYR